MWIFRETKSGAVKLRESKIPKLFGRVNPAKGRG
jgi:hypothetical protein